MSHDQSKALSISDRIAVMNRGRVMQVGSPRELYESPGNEFVASFIGSPPLNLLDVRSGVPFKLPVSFNGGLRQGGYKTRSNTFG